MSLNRELNLEKISEKLRKFSKDRNWEQYHSPKNLYGTFSRSCRTCRNLSVVKFGGTKEKRFDFRTRKQIEEEIADIFNYLVKFVDLMEIDLEKISLEKIQKMMKSILLKNLRESLKNIINYYIFFQHQMPILGSTTQTPF